MPPQYALVLVLVLEQVLEQMLEAGRAERRCEEDEGRIQVDVVSGPQAVWRDEGRRSAAGKASIMDNGRPTLREQRDGVWGIFGAWVREWAGMTRGGEKARDGPRRICNYPVQKPRF